MLYPVGTIAPPHSGPLVPAGRPAPRHPRCCPVPAQPPCRTDTTYSSRSRDPPGGVRLQGSGPWPSPAPSTHCLRVRAARALAGPPQRGGAAWRAAPHPPWLHTAQGQQLQVMGETSPGAGVPWDRAICSSSCPHCLIHLEQLHASSDKIPHIFRRQPPRESFPGPSSLGPRIPTSSFRGSWPTGLCPH